MNAEVDTPLQCRTTGNERTIEFFLLFESFLLVLLIGLVRFCCTFWAKKKLQDQGLGSFLDKRDLQDFKTWSSIESISVPDKSEFDVYFEEEYMQLDEEHSKDFDVLLYWKLNEIKYPTLSIMARDVLSIPITTVASEHLSALVDVF